MTIIITVTKVSVTYVMPSMYALTLNLNVIDGTTTLIDKNFTENYQVPTPTEYVLNRFYIQMQEAIDNYKREKDIFNSAQLNTAISILQSRLTW